MGQGQDESVERFRPTSGRAMGGAGEVLALTGVGAGVASGTPVLVAGSVLLGALVWAALLRPRLQVDGEELVLHNMLETVRLPLAAVEELIVRQVLVIRSGERRFVSPALSRSRRALWRDRQSAGPVLPSADVGRAHPASRDYAIFVEERLRHLVKEARERLGLTRTSELPPELDARITRTPARLEIGLLVASVVALAGTLLL